MDTRDAGGLLSTGPDHLWKVPTSREPFVPQCGRSPEAARYAERNQLPDTFTLAARLLCMPMGQAGYF